jgi:hypothetical protein
MLLDPMWRVSNIVKFHNSSGKGPDNSQLYMSRRRRVVTSQYQLGAAGLLKGLCERWSFSRTVRLLCRSGGAELSSPQLLRYSTLKFGRVLIVRTQSADTLRCSCQDAPMSEDLTTMKHPMNTRMCKHMHVQICTHIHVWNHCECRGIPVWWGCLV